jgi:hypothetical protein
MCRKLHGFTAPLAASEAPSEQIMNWEGGPLWGDDYALEYFEDGYPKIPACLDRREPRAFEDAA